MLINLSHRGARGAEENTGDGAGMLLAQPHEFYCEFAAEELERDVPDAGRYGVGIVFLPRDRSEGQHCRAFLEEAARGQGQEVLGWRRVPTNNAPIGQTARASEPVMEQFFVAAAEGLDQDEFERRLYGQIVINYHQGKITSFDICPRERIKA